MKLQGKTALITGSARRIGREIALLLASRGMSIVIHYSNSSAEAKSLKREIEAMGPKATLIKQSFKPTKSRPLKKRIDAIFRELKRRKIHIDLLVNNASVFYPTPLEKVSSDVWDEILDVNLKAPFLLSQKFGLEMKKRKCGKIVNLVDWTAFRSKKRFIPYAISKAGLISLTAGLAKALAPNVQTLSIAPGPILPVKGSSKAERKRVADATLLKRYGHPRDIAQTIRFFAEDTDYITGAMIPVDGGASLV